MNHLKIAVCDDEASTLDRISSLVESKFSECKCNYELSKFTNGKDLILSNCEVNYDIIFLDIDMPGTNGIEAAAAIKHGTPNTIIIFITGRDELVFESIKTQPFRFIRKSRLMEEISEAVSEAYKLIERSSYKLTIKIDNKLYKIDVGVITYIESDKNYITVNTFSGKKFRYKQSISTIEEELEPYGFIRVHSGYMVNQKYIQRIDGNDVIIRNDSRIPISRAKKQYVQQKLLEYLR
ncbi:MAG: LytTR family DNA-binding domain-containing protein [Sedimentibacter sp.]|uniref:LytR/AlgR family response regulator transcription factor n=1 Tax=Sedimentibacter sp. TaxID=1960295 RepID=UPI0031583E84